MAEIFPKEILDSFDWSFTGLTGGRDGEDTTLWIGSRGAHTPCHQVDIFIRAYFTIWGVDV